MSLPSNVPPIFRRGVYAGGSRRHWRSFWPRTTSFLLVVRLPVGVAVVVKAPISSLPSLPFYLQKSGLRRSWYTPVYKRYLILGAGPCGGAAGGGGGCGIALPKLPLGIHYGKGGQK